jgi:flagellar biosynthesis protein FlhG
VQLHFDKPGQKTGAKREAPTLWAIGGGKGGVGKSVFASSLSVAIAGAGESCAIVDADFGAANLHTLLGVPRPQLTLSDFIAGEVKDLNEVMAPTPVRNLSLVSGSRALLEMANLKHQQKLRLLRHLEKLDADHVVVDLGAGTAFNVLDFFVAARRAIVVVVPEPTSIENAYHFLRAAFYRALRTVARRPEAKDALRKVLDERGTKPVRSARDLIIRVRDVDPIAGKLLHERAAAFAPKLVVNQAVTPEHRRVGWDVSAASREHLGINLGYLGAVDLDPQVTEALARHQPVMQLFPSCRFSKRVDTIAQRLLRDLGDPAPSAADKAAQARQQNEEMVTWGIGTEENAMRRRARTPEVARMVGAPASPAASAPRLERKVTLPPVDVENPGAYLRRCRELLGVSLEDLTERTRIRGLDRVENERFDELPPPPHLNNFVLQYARALGIRDIDAAVDAYLEHYHRTVAKAELA